jgi:hypothetical protein
MSSPQRLFALLLAVLGMIGISASPAGAAGSTQCASTTSLGKICIQPQGGSYRATYTNTTSSTKYVDFNLVVKGGSRFGDNGAFSTSPGQTRSYIFALNNPGVCVRLYLYDRTGRYLPIVTGYTC